MRRVLVLVVVVSVAAVAPLAAGSSRWSSAAEPAKLVVKLKQENRSGQSGTAVLVSRKRGFDVVLRVSRPVRFPGNSQNAHIHDVTCAKYRRIKGFSRQLATVADSLYNLDRGRSTSTVGVPLAKRTTGTFSINVHDDNAPYTVVACGDIPKRRRDR